MVQTLRICDLKVFVNSVYTINIRILVSNLNNGGPLGSTPTTATATDASHLHPVGTASTAALPPLAPSSTTPPGVITQQPSSTTPTNTQASVNSAIGAAAAATAHFAEVENLAPGGGGSFGSTSGQSAFSQLANRRRSSEWNCITVPSSSQGYRYFRF